MATNKNAAIRYKVLDKAFRNPGKRYFIDDLIQECTNVLKEIDPDSDGISRRQVINDITYMESAEGWSVELNRLKDGKKTYYRYCNINYSISNMPLNDREINQLQFVLTILSRFKGMPQFDFIPGLISRLQQGINAPAPLAGILEFDSNEYLKGIDFLGRLYDAISYKQVLTIRYKPYEKEKASSLVFHPYYLRQYNSRWFTFGYNPELNRSDWNLALDRIESIEDTSICYIENKEIDWTEYFEDIIGVTRPETEIEDVILHFSGKTGKYMESKPIHGSQKSKWLNEHTFEVRLKLYINYELERLIFSYADTVQVLSPERLRQTISNKLKAGLCLNP